MASLAILGHSTVYRNPHPNRSSEYVAFPAIQALPDDVLLCMCRHGSARESDDGLGALRTWAERGVGPAGVALRRRRPHVVRAGARRHGSF